MASEPHILIAEDDFEDRMMMSETFKELGYESALLLLEDGIQLIDYLKIKGAAEVNLIVLDLNMPRLSGTETLRLLKSSPEYSRIPVIIFSTSINEIEKNICLSLGAKEYITKPSTYKEYISTCEKLYTISREITE